MIRWSFALLLFASPASAALTPVQLEALRAVDLRLAGIAQRLVVGNVALCTDRQPSPGIVLHAIDQYEADERPAARQVFGFPVGVAVEAVVPGSPADTAGVRAGDGVIAIGGEPMPAPAAATVSAATRDAAVAILASRSADRPLQLILARGNRSPAISVPAQPGCRAAFEVLLGPKMTASSDGRIVQIGVRFFERYGDDQVAAVVAHELAHLVLRHRARLEAAGVKWGLLAEFGRNGRLFRQTEEDADRLSVHLLRNAGYDPAAAPGFWRDHGGDVDGGFFRARTHPSSGTRASALAAEIASIPADAPRPYLPPVLATRNQPLR